MRFYHAKATALREQLAAQDAAHPNAPRNSKEGRRQTKLLREAIRVGHLAAKAAAKAAPYVHSRAGYDDEEDDPEFIPLADRVLEMDRRAQLAETSRSEVPYHSADAVRAKDDSPAGIVEPVNPATGLDTEQ